MISAQYYQYIYLFLVTILTINCLKKYKIRVGSDIQENINKSRYTEGFFVLLIVASFIGLRPVDRVFVDMFDYHEQYLSYYGTPYEFDPLAENLIWDQILPLFAAYKIPSELYFFIISCLYFGIVFYACKRLFPNDSYIAFLVFLAAFSTFTYGTNGIKAGLAASLFTLVITYRDNLKVCIPFVLLTYTFHHSMVIPVVAFLCTLFNNNHKYYFYFWLFSIIIAVGHVSFFQELFAGFTDERGAEYLIGEDAFQGGFRPDFIVYSAMPICLGWHAIKKMGANSKMYYTLLNTYTLANSVWMLCMYASFSNRIAYLSWFLYPIVLIYPILNDNWKGNRYIFFAKVASYHLAFTLFMQIIYYGLLKSN